MITDASEYIFVTGENVDADHPHGDLDRIIIDGDIMPLRTGTTSTGVDRKRLLRGEDVAFLQEAIHERAEAAGIERTTSYLREVAKFDRRVLAHPKEYWCRAAQIIAGRFLKSHPTEQFTITGSPSLPTYSADELQSDPDDFFGLKKALSLDATSRMFADARMMTSAFSYKGSMTEGPFEEHDHVDLDPEHRYTGIVGGNIGFDTSGGLGPYPQWAGRTWNCKPLTFSRTLAVPVSAVEFWGQVSFGCNDYENGLFFYADDFVKLGDATSSDGQTWTLSLDYASLKALLIRIATTHRNRGEIVRVPEFQAGTVGDEYECWFNQFQDFFYSVVTLGDHTKWW